MTNPFSVDTTVMTVLGYPMSFLELAGTVLYLASVWLIARRNVLTWPVGLVGIVLFMMLFYQIRLYADALEQVYYVGASVYGWWYWSRPRSASRIIDDVRYGSPRTIARWAIVTTLAAVALGWAMTRVHVWLPGAFPEPAAFPRLDALTTVMSLTAMWLMARKHVESWIYWIVVDVLAIGIYFAKGILFVTLLYVVLLVLASRGLVNWMWAARSAYAQPDAAPAIDEDERAQRYPPTAPRSTPAS